MCTPPTVIYSLTLHRRSSDRSTRAELSTLRHGMDDAGPHAQGRLPHGRSDLLGVRPYGRGERGHPARRPADLLRRDRKTTRLNSSHANISYAVFCLKKKNNET